VEAVRTVGSLQLSPWKERIRGLSLHLSGIESLVLKRFVVTEWRGDNVDGAYQQ